MPWIPPVSAQVMTTGSVVGFQVMPRRCSGTGLRTKRSWRSAVESGWPMKSLLYVSGERYAAIAEIEHMTVK